MNSSIQTRSRKVLWLLLVAWHMSGGIAPAQESLPQSNVVEQLTIRFRELEAEQQRLLQAGDHEAARTLDVELGHARKMHNGDFLGAQSDALELHAVGLGAGGAAPGGVLSGKDRFIRGYAEVSVLHTAAPIILFVSAGERTHFQFSIARGVRLVAVVFGGRYTSSFSGLPDDALIFQSATDAREGLGIVASTWGDANFQEVSRVLREFTGRDPLTVTAAARYKGTPLIVGPDNPTWRAQYVMARTEGAHQRIVNFVRDQQIAKLADVRFQCLYYQPSNRGGLDLLASEGEFTIAGPLMNSLRPTHSMIRHLVHEPKNGLDFAIDHWMQFVVFDPAAGEFARVPLGNDFPNEVRFNSLAFDAKRGRIIVTSQNPPHEIYAYDLADSSWNVLSDHGPDLSSLVYVPERDEYIGVTTVDDSVGAPRAGANICRLNADGQVVELISPKQDVKPTWLDRGGTTLNCRGDQLFIATPPSKDETEGFQSHLQVVDMKTHEVLYTGVTTPHSGQRARPGARDSKPPNRKRLLHRLFDQLALAAEIIKDCNEQGKNEQAEQLARRVKALQKRRAGKWGSESNAKARLHLVSNRSVRNTIVEVAPQPEPAILVLCSYKPVRWSIRVADGAKLDRVIVAGHHRQIVAEIPDGVPLDSYAQETGEGGFYIDSREHPTYQTSIQRIKALTNLAPWTFQEIGPFQESHVIIGPESGDWLAQCITKELDELLKGALTERHARELQSLDRLRFTGIYRTKDARQHPNEPAQLRYAEFSVRGPRPPSLTAIPGNLEEAVTDVETGDLYGCRGNEIVRVDSMSGEITPLPFNDVLPHVARFTAIAFDASRRRLLLTCGGLYAYDITSKQWSTLSSAEIHAFAMVHLPDENAVCTLGIDARDGSPLLRKFNLQGAAVGTYGLPTTEIGPHVHSEIALMDLAYVDGHVAVLGPLVQDPLDPLTLLPEIHVFDLETCDFIYDGLLRPHPGIMELSPERLDELWEALGGRNAPEAEQAQWNLAAGHTGAVNYIAGRLSKFVPPDKTVVRKHLKDLDSDDFETRRAAQEALAKYGRSIVPILETERENPSAEVRASVQRLLRAAAQAIPEAPELAREVRAMQVLEIIGTPEAIALLRDVATGTSALDRTAAAQAALDRLGQSGDPEK